MPADQPTVIQRVDKSFDLLSLHEYNSARYPYLLQTVAHTTQQVHFDILFACPLQTLSLASSGDLSLFMGNADASSTKCDNSDFLATFEKLWHEQQVISNKENNIPFHGGWFLYLGYELA